MLANTHRTPRSTSRSAVEPGGQLRLEVRNPLRLGSAVSATPGSGLGLLGLTERAELIGGRLEHLRSDGDFVVRAWLPWPA